MNLSEERLAEFNSRLNQWIGKQGLLFQLTHEGTGLGGRPPLVGSIIRFCISIFLLVVLTTLGYVGYLVWQATGDDLPEKFGKGIRASLAAEEETGMLLGFERNLSSGSYQQIQLTGSQDSFFNHLDAREVSFKMEPTTGLFGNWNAGSINIEKLRIAIKAGEVDDQRAETAWQALFKKHPGFSFSKLEVEDASLSWGYSSPATWGSILSSRLTISRKEEGFTLQFIGGTFSQGIFRGLTINKLIVEITPENTLTVSEAILEDGEGTLTFSGRMTSNGSRPLFEFNGSIEQLPIASFLPPVLTQLIGGSLSGDIVAIGSTNDANGINVQLDGKADPQSSIVLTKGFAVLEMLSHLDPQRSYRKLIFNEGTFNLETKGSTLNFSDINLSSFDEDSAKSVARLRGGFEARATTQQDYKAEPRSSDDEETNQRASTSESNQTVFQQEENKAEFEKLILSRYQDFQFEKPHQELRYITHDSNNNELKKNRVDIVARQRFRTPYRVKGALSLSILASTFDDFPPLPSVAPTADNDGLKSIKLELRELIPAISQELRAAWQEAMREDETYGIESP